ncbi:MAG: NADH-quinone oxidoreductase subunit NuoE [Fimbriimonadaceae bacterium]|nr:NADH-quinone oxidoreductase subunit NuoE [Fimbriimonadaceae bacterium]
MVQSDLARELDIDRFGVEAVLFKALDDFMAEQQYSPDSLIEVLHRGQEMFGYLREDVLKYVARKLSVPLARVYGVATFYHLFHLKPHGKYEILVCMGTACYVRGAERIISALESQLGVKMGETTNDGLFTLICARCIGACGIAPAVKVGTDVHGKVEAKKVRRMLRKYEGK